MQEIQYQNGSKYFGELKNNKKNGIGIHHIKRNGNFVVRYLGEFNNNLAHGNGILAHVNGGKYIGEFKNNKYSKNGMLFHEQGEKYIGEFKNGKYHGNGILISPYGEKYIGEFYNGKYNGYGTLTFSNGAKFIGEFKNGKYTENGTLDFPEELLPPGWDYMDELEKEYFSHCRDELNFSEAHYYEKPPLTDLNELYLFFDTETTGLPVNWNAPITDLDNWPRLVQLAYVLCNRDGLVVSQGDYIIKPEGFSIPKDAENIHGISNVRAIIDGKKLASVLEEFISHVEQADYLIAHNISFDINVLGAEFLRTGLNCNMKVKRKFCTMEESVNFCAIKGPYGYKWPTLTQLHYKLFNLNYRGVHNAMDDALATYNCFWKLREYGVI